MHYLYSCHRFCFKRLFPIYSNAIHTFDSKITAPNKFQSNENGFAHQVLESIIPAHKNTLADFNSTNESLKQWAKTTDTVESILNRILKEFCSLALEDPEKLAADKFRKFTNGISPNIKNFSHDDLLKFIHATCFWSIKTSTPTIDFRTLWNTLDSECTGRIGQWTRGRILLVGDYWYQMGLARISRYNRALINVLLCDLHSLDRYEMIQLLFYINLQRNIRSDMMLKVEKKLLPMVKELSIDELGIVCMAFFKTNTKITSPDLLENVMLHAIHGFATAPVAGITCSAIFKVLRRNGSHSQIDLYENFITKSLKIFRRLDIMALAHLCSLVGEMRIYNKKLVESLIDAFSKQMESMRLKDMMKLCFFLLDIGYTLEEDLQGRNFYAKVLKELEHPRRFNEIKEFPNNLTTIMYVLTCNGIFNHALLEKVLSPHFIMQATRKGDNFLRESHVIDCIVELECPEYRGPRMQDQEISEVLMNYPHENVNNSNKEQNYTTRLTVLIADILKQICKGEEFIQFVHVLPHHQLADVVVGINKDGKFIKIPRWFKDNSGKIIRPPTNDKWCLFMVGGRKFYCQNVDRKTGLALSKIRQLQKLGYHVIEIPWRQILKKYQQEKKQFLESKLEEANGKSFQLRGCQQEKKISEKREGKRGKGKEKVKKREKEKEK